MIRLITEHAGGGGAIVLEHACAALAMAATLSPRLRVSLEVGERHTPCGHPQPRE